MNAQKSYQIQFFIWFLSVLESLLVGIICFGSWQQKNNVSISSNPNIIGIELQDPAEWKQQGSLSNMISSNNTSGRYPPFSFQP